MRDLTPQEIADAPECDTHYGIWDDGVLDYYDFSGEVCVNDERLTIDGFEFAKIPRKEFDISEYEFSDGDMDIIIEADGGVFVSVDSDRGLYANLSRNDIIALAKHSKLTAEDLK